jgi:hypothetical protein
MRVSAASGLGDAATAASALDETIYMSRNLGALNELSPEVQLFKLLKSCSLAR